MSAFHDNALIGASGQGGYFLSRSLRFRSSASAFLSRTFGTPTDNRKWTISFWMKRGILDGRIIFASSVAPSFIVFFDTSNRVDVRIAGTQYFLTTPVYRDPSAWYHFQLVFDSANATQANRIILYINGVQQTASVQTCPLNQTTGFNAASTQSNLGFISGWFGDARDYFDGYMTEVNFIDGQALTPSSFGMNDPNTGVWEPIRYAGTYGTNGFYLPFTDTSSTTNLVADRSGRGNNWTPNNISLTAGATYDSMTDVPTLTGPTAANYAVMNPLAVTAANSTITNGNLQVVTPNVGGNALATMGIPASGKWYFEVTPTSGGSEGMIGVSAYTVGSSYLWQNTNNVFYFGSGGQKYVDGSGSSYGASYTNNDVIGVACDSDASTITFYKNNVSQGSISHTMVDMFPALSDGASAAGTTFQVNFGQQPFVYTPPTGFNRLNTFNLPTPTIGATPSSQANKYFDATTYNGTSANQTITNSGSFQPDLVWTKPRNAADFHALTDAVRGASRWLTSNGTNSEFDYTGNNSGVKSFVSNGFTLQADASQIFNDAARTYVAWQWRASNATGVTNTAGSITSTVSANTTAGFSIVTYTGNGNNGESVGHGLGVKPAFIITKKRSGGTDYGWSCWHKDLGGTNAGIWLDKTSARNNSMWTDSHTSTTFRPAELLYNNESGATYVNYCFAEVAGYSRFGSYTGNGSSDGPFVFCGFRPRFVMIKRTDSSDVWFIYDTARNTSNVVNLDLYPNLSNAEASSVDALDIVSNGFKLRNTGANRNASGGTYIYAAFAESPFKYANAR